MKTFLIDAHRGLTEVTSLICDALVLPSVEFGTTKMLPIASIENLPNEVLMQIFELACYDEYLYGELATRSISLVSKRWQSLIYTIPKIWNKFTLQQSSEVIDACLKRVGTFDIEVNLHDLVTPIKDTLVIPRVLDQLLPYSRQWETLALCAIGSPTTSADLFFKTIRDSCGSLELPNLRTLRIVRLVDDGPVDDDLSGDLKLHLYSSWSMPNLENLRVGGFVPHTSLGPTLLFCSLSLPDQIMDPMTLFDFLRSLSRIRELELIIKSFDDGWWSTLPVHLPTLQKLTIEYMDTQPDFASSFIALLDIPNVIEMQLSASLSIWSDLYDLLDCFGQERQYQSIKKFKVKLNRSTTAFDHFINKIFESLPNLEHFGINANDKHDSNMASTFSCPPLKSLRFEKCDAFNGSVMTAILNQIERDGRLDKLEKVEVSDCPTFRDNRYDEIMQSEKLKGKVSWDVHCAY